MQARFSGKRDVFGTGYVMRSQAYDAIGGIPKFNKLSFADDALWLMLIGDGLRRAVKVTLFKLEFMKIACLQLIQVIGLVF